MAGQSFAMFGWSWTEVSVLGSQLFGQAFMESCDPVYQSRIYFWSHIYIKVSQNLVQ